MAISTIAYSQPANDVCASAQTITPDGTCVSGTTTSSTDNWSSTVGCQSGSPNNHPDVWYRFVSTGTSYLGTVTGSGSWSGNVEFTLVSGTCNGGFTVVGSACGASPLSVNISGLSVGTTYYFTVSNAANGTTGPFQVCSNTPAAPCTSGQTCSTPTVITYTAGVQTCFNGCTNGAPAGPDFTGNNCYDFPNSTVWYQITTGPSTATIDISIASAALTNPYFTVFTTPNCLNYTIINCTQGSGGAVSGTVPVSTSTTYLIAISNGNATQGNFNACFTVNNDNSACNRTDAISVSATSMGSPLSGPYQPGEIVTFCYTITDFQQINCNYLQGIVPTFGDCWDPVSFTAQGRPVNITTPLTTAGTVQPCPPGPPCAWSTCAGTPSGTWSWYPAGSVNYNNINNPSIPNGTALGAGWFFTSSYDPLTGNCSPDPTDPDNSYGDSNFPNCAVNTLDWQVCFQLQARSAIACTNGQTDCTVSMKTYADGEIGVWNNVGCTADLRAVFPATLYCCTPPVVAAGNNGPYCAGSSAQLTASGGVSYSWSGPGGYTSTVQSPIRTSSTPSMSGVYTVTVTDINGCTATASTSLMINAAPVLAPTATPTPICNGGSTTLNANATAGSGTISTYAWSSGIAGNSASGTVSPTSTTIYTVTVTDSNGCTTSGNVTVNVNALPTVNPSASPAIICSGNSTTLSANATAGSGTIFSYTWSSGIGGNSAGGSVSPTTTTTYMVTVTNSNGCSATGNTTVTVNQRPVVNPNVTPSPICNGVSTSLNANATAGSGTISSYAWSSGIIGNNSGGTVSPTSTTTYVVTVFNSNGCSATGSTTVTVNAIPTVTPTAVPTSLCLGNSTTLSANATAGSGTISTYAWSNGIAGNLSSGTVTPTATTNYIVTVTNSNGCSATGSVNVTLSYNPNVTVTATPTSICNGNSATLTTNATTGSGTISTYAWSSGVIGSNSGGTVTPSSTTTYTVTVTNSNGCSATGSTTINVNQRPVINPNATPTPICNGGSTTLNANATAGSGTISTYAWSSGIAGNSASGTVSPTSTTTYTVTVTNSNGCTASANTTVDVNALPTPTSSNTGPYCAGNNISLSALGGNSYSWSGPNGFSSSQQNPAISSATTSMAGQYVVTITDANNCSATTATTVVVNPTPVASASNTGPYCPSSTIQLSTNGGSTYTWSGPQSFTSNQQNPLLLNSNLSMSGVYQVTVTDLNNCTATASTNVIINNALIPVASNNGPQCSGNSIQLQVAGGSSFTWSGPNSFSSAQQNPTINNSLPLNSGVYYVTATDLNGCSGTASTNVIINSLPLPSATNNSPVCVGQSIQFNSSGGTSYSWSGPNSFSSLFQNPVINTSALSSAGSYSVAVTDANGCSATATTSVIVNTLPIANAGPDALITCTNSQTNLTAPAIPPGYTYSWTGPNVVSGGNTSSPTVESIGTYTLVVTDVNGCSSSDQAVVAGDNAIPDVNAGSDDTLTCSIASLQLTATSSVSGVNFAWSTGTNGSTTSVFSTGNYSVTVTDPSNGCSAVDLVQITANLTPPNVDAGPDTDLTCSTTSINLTGSSSTSNVSYTWSNGTNNATTTVSSPGNYTLTITNQNNGCTATDTVTVSTNYTTPVVSVVADTLLTCSISTVTLTAATSTGSAVFNWSNGTNNVASSIVNISGNYTVTATDATSGCSASANVSVGIDTTTPPVTVTPSNFNITCVVAGTALTAQSSMSNLSYLWSDGDSIAVNYAGTPGIYSVTATNPLNGCTASATSIIGIDTVAPDGYILVPDTLDCSTASFQITAVSNTPGVLYIWAGLGSGAIRTINNPGAYAMIFKSLNGCIKRDTAFVLQNLTSPDASIIPADTLNCINSTVTLQATNGTQPYLYEWSTGIVATSSIVSQPGPYSLTVTDVNTGCSDTSNVVVAQNINVPSISINNPDTLSCTITNAILTVSSPNSNLAYIWSNGINGSTISVPSSGSYTVTGTDLANGCSVSQSVSVVQNISPPTVSLQSSGNLDCANNSVSLNATSSSGVTFNWSNGGIGGTNTVTTAGTYVVTATEPANGCSSSDQIIVTANTTLPNVNAGVDTTLTCSVSSIQITATSSTSQAQFLWSNGVNTATNTFTSAGTYVVTVTDPANGCTSSDNLIVSNSSTLPDVDAGNDFVLHCNVSSTTLTATSSINTVSFTWSNGTNGATTTVTAPGTYFVTATNTSNGCIASDQVVISIDTVQPNLSAGKDTSLTCTVNSITLLATSITPGVSYTWSNGPTTASNTISTSGIYEVTATDTNNGCSTSDQITVRYDNSIPNVDAGTDDTLNCSFTSLTLSGTSTTPGALFTWSNTANTQTTTISSSGVYILTVTDPINGCSASDQVNVSIDTIAPVVSINPASTLTCSVLNSTITTNSSISTAAYMWNDGAATSSINVSMPGLYVVTITDFTNGCSSSASVNVIQNVVAPGLSILNNDTLTCSNTAVNLSAQSNASPTSYLWSTGATSSAISVSNGGLYTLTATDLSNACSASAIQTVEIDTTSPSVVIATPAVLTCNITSVTLSASTNVLSTGYLWSNGGSNNTTNVTSAGTYSITVSDLHNGCSASTATTVTSLSSLSLSLTSTNLLCNGDNTGSTDLTIAGGQTPYTILWSNGSSSEDLLSVPAGNYTVSVTDDAGCIATSSTTVSQPQPFSVSAIRNNVACNGGSSASIAISPSGGTAPYTYSWNDGTTTQNRNFISAGTYALTVTDTNSCSFSLSMIITEPSPLSVIETHTDVSCNGLQNGTITLNTNGGATPYQFSWNDGNASANRTNLDAGNYSVVVTDSNSCSVSVATNISEPSALNLSESHSDVLCNGNNTGSIVLSYSGGTSPYNFLWNDGITSATRNNLIAGNYSITLTDNNRCSTQANMVITEPQPLAATETHNDILCNGASTGNIDMTMTGGITPYAYLWNTGVTSDDLINISAGSYTLTITDANQCSIITSIVLTEPQPLSLQETHNNIACSGGYGDIDVTSSGGIQPYSYIWNDGLTTEDRSNLQPGIYAVTLSDNNLCSASTTVTISSNAGIVITETHTDALCFGSSNATIDITVTGGISPYVYTWNDASTVEDRLNLTAGTYTLTVTDNNSCIQINSITITEPTALSTTEIHQSLNCFGDNSGTISLLSSGGIGLITYLWSDGSTLANRLNLPAGNYSVISTDANLCSASISVSLSEPNAVAAAESHTDVLCNGDSSGSIQITTSGGTVPYQFIWNDNDINPSRTNLTAGIYTITITDNNLCSLSQTVTITEPTPVSVSETHSDATCFGNNDGSASVNVSGGVSPYTYLWNDGNGNPVRNNLNAGLYSITITDNNSCSAVLSTVSISQPTALSITETHNDVSCFGYSDGSASISVSGGTTPYRYLWENGTTTGDRSNLNAGSYQVTVSDVQGCSITTSLDIIEPSETVLNSNLINPTCESVSPDGTISLQISGGAAPYSYVWSNGALSSSLQNLRPGAFSVTVTDANSCSLSSSFNLSYSYSFDVTASPSVEIDLGESTELSYTLSGNTGNYNSVWSPDFSLSCTECPFTEANPLATTVYHIIITNEAGCTADDYVTVTVIPDHTVYIPNGFSPNGDGNNDVFEVYTKANALKFLEVKVFNRWGEKVFESNNHQFGWDGIYKGEMQNPGVFVYTVKVVFADGYSAPVYTGSLTLIR